MQTDTKQILGVDCGDTIFHYITGVPVAGAIDSLTRIAKSGRFDEIHLVSKVDRFSEYFYRFTLWRIGFWRRTGIPRTNIIFCRRYADKAPICERLGVTHFVDDRLEVLTALGAVPYRYAFKPRPREAARYSHLARNVVTVTSWAALLSLVLTQ